MLTPLIPDKSSSYPAFKTLLAEARVRIAKVTPHFAGLIYRLNPVIVNSLAPLLGNSVNGDKMDPERSPAATDGLFVYLAAPAFDLLFADENVTARGDKSARLAGIITHEMWHCVNAASTRKGGKDAETWSFAEECVVNGLTRQSGWPLFNGLVELPEGWKGESIEDLYYKFLREGPPKGKQRDFFIQRDPEDGKPSQEPATGQGGPSADTKWAGKEQWQEALAECDMKAMMGGGPVDSYLSRSSASMYQSPGQWIELLARQCSDMTQADASWSDVDPEIHHLTGAWLPSTNTPAIRHLVLACDTSGSIGEREIRLINGVCEAIGMTRHAVGIERTTILWCDTSIRSVQEFTQDEAITPKPAGGGGTDFRPVFEWVTRQAETPTLLLFLTDGCGYFPDTAPDYPVVWVGVSNFQPPFGDFVRVL